ncbi:ABC transporter ATP-binding protein [Pseudothermotoga thermarum]|uniref:ABC transporter related protein n=1 Tax=Pseudothermotoga thermarum DSM 5069 TaxID=688269 RepID=F7YUG8_9THEM|nr:ABC transporter ATP-binding protein [Pseudothermotoga thermarum]AEH51439.1 ABC transporter related protein [Pseudothermotoga thermarum DSM 5069]
MIIVKNLWKVYGKGEKRIEALRGINLTIEKGEFVTILGPSGSGKTTLLNCLSGIDSPTEGEIFFDGVAFHLLNEEQKTKFRAENMGFVFQFFNLIPVLTVLENVELPLRILGLKGRKVTEKVVEMLKKVGLAGKEDKFPSQLSGGEQQRVAIARALVHNPKIVWADEPTGNLDSETGAMIINLLERMRAENGTTLVVVTHDEKIAQRADRILLVRDGRIIKELSGSNTVVEM